MYMESLRQEDGYHVLGGFDDVRIHAARYRLLHDHFYVPLAEFCYLRHASRSSTTRASRTLYSQAAGLTHFLIHYDGGRYRDSLVAYLVAVYTGRATLNTLSQLTGTSYAELDHQYREFMESGLANYAPPCCRGRPPWRLESRRGGGKITQRAATEGGR